MGAEAQIQTLLSQPCPNLCSGHGWCDSGDRRCRCYAGYQGPDCSERLCPVGPAWADHPDSLTVSDVAHLEVECSNRGHCERAQGACVCVDGFTGASLQHGVPRSATDGANVRSSPPPSRRKIWEWVSRPTPSRRAAPDRKNRSPRTSGTTSRCMSACVGLLVGTTETRSCSRRRSLAFLFLVLQCAADDVYGGRWFILSHLQRPYYGGLILRRDAGSITSGFE